MFIPEWDLCPEFPELNLGHSVGEVTTRDMFP